MMLATGQRHADGCPGDCPQWIVAGAPSCLPYPCQCAATRIDTKERYPWSDGACWWWAKLSGKIKSRCPCWGGKRDGKPGDCCTHHSANPLYAVTTAAGIDQAGADQTADEPSSPPECDKPPTDADDILDAWIHDGPARKEFVRRWPPEALTCPCTLVFAKTSAAVHCVACCQHFANPATFSIHRRDWTQPCRPPWSIVDVDTGRSLLAQDGAGVWRDSYPG